MKRRGYIYEKIYDTDNLIEAHKQARKGKSTKRSVRYTDEHIDQRIKELQYMLANETYVVSKYETEIIFDKTKERKLLKLPYYPDRIIQWAIMLQIEEDFVKRIPHFSCASIKGRGIKHAFNLTQQYLREDKEGTQYCLKMDISKFYDNVDREILKKRLRRIFKDAKLLRLLDQIIDSPPGDKGIPIGSYLSQYFANYYLADFDHWLKETLGVKYCVRYMDDVVIMSNSKEQLHEWRKLIEEYLRQELNLTLKRNWQVFPVEARGIDFVGYRFYHDKTRIRKRTAKAIFKKMYHIWKVRRIMPSDVHMYYSYMGTVWRSKSLSFEKDYLRGLEGYMEQAMYHFRMKILKWPGRTALLKCVRKS